MRSLASVPLFHSLETQAGTARSVRLRFGATIRRILAFAAKVSFSLMPKPKPNKMHKAKQHGYIDEHVKETCMLAKKRLSTRRFPAAIVLGLLG